MNHFESEPLSRFVPSVDEAANFFALPLLIAENNFIARRKEILQVIIPSHLMILLHVSRIQRLNLLESFSLGTNFFKERGVEV